MIKRTQSVKFQSLKGVLVTILVLMPFCTKVRAQTQIRAGEGMGAIHIHETRASILKQLGKPTKTVMWESLPIRQDTWVGKASKSRLVVFYATENTPEKVIQIETTSPKFFTPNGLSVQSTSIDVFRWLGRDATGMFLKSNRSQNPSYYTLLYDKERGIAFLLKATSKSPQFWTSEKIMVYRTDLPMALFSLGAYKPINEREFKARPKN